MEREEVVIRFADLRRLACEVPGWLAGRAGVKTTPSLAAGVEEEFSIVSPDTDFLLLEFAETYRVDLRGFDFTDYISPDGLSLRDTLLLLPLTGYLLLGWLLKLLVVVCLWPFSRRLAGCVWRRPVPRFWLPSEPAARGLTFGDFVASAAVGRFVTRGQVRFQLARG